MRKMKVFHVGVSEMGSTVCLMDKGMFARSLTGTTHFDRHWARTVEVIVMEQLLIFILGYSVFSYSYNCNLLSFK